MSRSRSPNTARIQKAYQFLIDHEKSGQPFTKAEIIAATGYAKASIDAHISKKWIKLIERDGDAIRVIGVRAYTLDEFIRIMSQRNEISADPRKPHFKPEVECHLRKARESALLALQIYNNPMTTFRTEGYSVMMVIAWTALFHAIFEHQGKDYFYLVKETGKPKLVDGDHKAWELTQCLDEFYGDNTTPIRTNLEFFIRLRNKIEHRYVPEIDPTVACECQAMLLNFDELLVEKFGPYFAIRESLALPLHTAQIRPDATLDALKKLQARHFDEITRFITDYRAAIPATILGDQKFRFSVFMIPKPANHPTADHAIEFVKATPENEAEIARLAQGVVLIKDRIVANAGHLKATAVVAQVAAGLGKIFHLQNHTNAWKRYDVRRPLKKHEKVTCDGCKTQYCIPDPVHNDYVYTPAWVEFLIKKLSNEKEYLALTKRSGTPPKKTG